MQTDQTDTVARFLRALSPANRDDVQRLPREKQEQMAEAWERYLQDDASLLTLSELDPAAAEHRAAENVIQDLL
ncbi:hypothetical protein AS594_35255 [Streptomyces agglomeratus]|uniref:Uncharacterized protein n=1 Tax=Streptomyces agglomeratus TaxID=285458 RepID=A0A1E5PH91_9ACTN|nr:hypothetical protein [Streptomyces agglomeratus]OEJ28902.1 hypothetical protein AS594_35255 [Streptomyces agglomeratus]